MASAAVRSKAYGGSAVDYSLLPLFVVAVVGGVRSLFCYSVPCVLYSVAIGKGIMTTVPAWCVSAHASFVFKIDSQKNPMSINSA